MIGARAEIEQIIAIPGITYPDQYGNPCYVRWVAGRRLQVAQFMVPILLIFAFAQRLNLEGVTFSGGAVG